MEGSLRCRRIPHDRVFGFVQCGNRGAVHGDHDYRGRRGAAVLASESERFDVMERSAVVMNRYTHIPDPTLLLNLVHSEYMCRYSNYKCGAGASV